MVSYAQRYSGPHNWHRLKRVLVAGATIWLVWLFGRLWILPSVEARLLAEPVEVTYLDGTLSLVGYRLSQEVLSPGDELMVSLYWRTNDFLQDHYIQSLHALTHPDIQSVAQYDTNDERYPERAWLPGVVVRQDMSLTFPADLETSRSYWLSLRFWSEDRETAITQTDRQKLSDDSLVLDSVVAVDRRIQSRPERLAGYEFAEGFTLFGYTLPESATVGEPLTVSFWWQTQRNIDTELTQFLHLFHQNGEDYTIFDQTPFGGRFPTQDWPRDMQAVDEWTVTLPQDMPPGEYRVHTGMFNVDNQERMPVAGEGGETVPDYSIVLGTLVVEASE